MIVKSGGVDAGLVHAEIVEAVRLYLKSHHNLEVKAEAVKILYAGDELDDVTCDFTGGMPTVRTKRPRRTPEVVVPVVTKPIVAGAPSPPTAPTPAQAPVEAPAPKKK